MRYLLITTLIILCYTASSQNLYYDALRLRKYVNETTGLILPETNEDRDTIKSILKKYDCNSSNPFLDRFRGPGQGFSTDAAPFNAVNIPGMLSSIGNLDVTKIADGFAKFIVERTKKELQAAFFDRFIKELENDSYKDLRTLFPNTWGTVKSLPEKIYSYDPFLQSLRNSFGKDLETILPNLESVVRNGQYKDFFNNHLELKSVVLTGLFFSKGLQKGVHIGKVLEDYNALAIDYRFTDPQINGIKNNAIQFLQKVSGSFRKMNSTDKEYYIPADSIQQFITDTFSLRIYAGLLYCQVKDLQIQPADRLTYGDALARLGTWADEMNEIRHYLEQISGEVQSLQDLIIEFRAKPKKEQTVDDYIGIFNNSMRLVASFRDNQLIRDVTDLLPAPQQEAVNKFWKYFENFEEASTNALSIYTSIQQKQYSVAIVHLRNLYEMRFDPEKIVNDSTKKRIKAVISFILEKGAFIAAAAEAKNSDEVYAVINKVAMPQGSARVKRLSNSNIAVNAYCGLFIGKEDIKGLPEKEDINAYGLSAPIGFSLSKGDRVLPWPIHGAFKAKGWSSTIFISVVDLGALAAYRFQNDTTSQVPTVQLKHIFSPGIFWSVGIPKTPLSLNLGAQVGPNLRKVKNDVNTFAERTYTRYSFSVVVDIPLLNLYTKTD